jgi:hypothetical protein
MANIVWLRIADVNVQPWQIWLVSHAAEATELSSGDVQQAIHWADREHPHYFWERVPASGMSLYRARGTPK